MVKRYCGFRARRCRGRWQTAPLRISLQVVILSGRDLGRESRSGDTGGVQNGPDWSYALVAAGRRWWSPVLSSRCRARWAALSKHGRMGGGVVTECCHVLCGGLRRQEGRASLAETLDHDGEHDNDVLGRPIEYPLTCRGVGESHFGVADRSQRLPLGAPGHSASRSVVGCMVGWTQTPDTGPGRLLELGVWPLRWGLRCLWQRP